MEEYKPFIDPRIRIGRDQRMGNGVFSSAQISKGEFLEIAPVVIMERMPEDKNLANYVVAWNGKFAVPLGWTMLYNHSDDNCCEYSVNFHDSLFAIIAVRDIEAGEQLTVNYGPDWFTSRNMQKV